MVLPLLVRNGEWGLGRAGEWGEAFGEDVDEEEELVTETGDNPIPLSRRARTLTRFGFTLGELIRDNNNHNKNNKKNNQWTFIPEKQKKNIKQVGV